VQRVAVLGCGGAGKSTFARKLGEATGLPVIHMDRLYWRPGWDPTPDDEWAKAVEEISNQERWITDGNYSRFLEHRLARADTIVLIDFPAWRCLPRIWKRTLRNYGKDTQAPGCPDRFDWAFTKWVAKYRRESLVRTLARIEEFAAGTRLHRLRTPRQVETFLHSLK
jgi:adenylate kinase family enzyme